MPAHMTPKPARGTAARARKARRRQIEQAERDSKRASKIRDGECSRYPGVPYDGTRLESAHLIDKQMGGDHGKFSHLPKHYVTLTANQHERLTLHFLKLEWDADAMGDGDLYFYTRRRIDDPWEFVGVSQPGDRHKGAA